MTAPIALFAFNRPAHLTSCLESLRANPEAAASALHVFCDGARHAADAEGVAAVRRIARAATGFASVAVVEQPENRGLARSVIAGVTALLACNETVIVVEDDLVVAPGFLRFMNDALDMYARDECVASVHGYVYPVSEPLPDSFFLRGADCWGWATWGRAWRIFEADGAALLRALRERGLERRFDLDGAYPYTRMLAEQVAGRNASWAVRWHASCFLRDMLTLYPGRSLVQNIGNDASGTHCADTGRFTVDIAVRPSVLQRIPLVESEAARRAFARFLRGSWGERLGGSIRTFAARVRRMVA